MYLNVAFFLYYTAAVYGKGVYFALSARYSAQDKYSAPTKDGHKHIFVCNVIVGKFITGNRQMKIAPPLPGNEHLLYDTLVDNESSPTIYVAMTDSQAYPEYLITFKTGNIRGVRRVRKTQTIGM